MKQERLTEGKYYHIYNRGNNRRDLFLEPIHYEHFLALYDKFITPVAETLAWVLMPNHFHLVVRIKENVVYKYSLNAVRSKDAVPDRITIGTGRFANETTGADLTVPIPITIGTIGNNVEITSDNVGQKLMEKTWFEDHKWETVEMELFNGVGKPKKPVPHRHFAHLFNAYARYFNKRTDGTGNLFERPFKRKLIHNERYLKQVILYVHNNPIHHGFCENLLNYPWSSYLTCVSYKPTKLNREMVLKLFNERKNFKSQHNQKIDIEKIEKWLQLDEVDYTTELDNDLNAVRFENETSGADLSVPIPITIGTIGNNIEKMIKDEVRFDKINAVRSGDADRLPDKTTKRDLSAYVVPDNVEKEENNIRKKIKNNVRPGQFNAVRSIDADRLPDEATKRDLSVPIPITIGTIGNNVGQATALISHKLGEKLGDRLGDESGDNQMNIIEFIKKKPKKNWQITEIK